MVKNILSLLVFLALNFNYASAEVTYSAFTKEGKALNNELSILNKDDKFRIIFFSDEENEFDLVIKTKNKILNQQKVKISNQITLPGYEMWLQLGKISDLRVKLSKDERYHMGFGALYCYESMVPEIAENKIDGLKKFYGVTDGEETLKFFEVHQHADKWHRQVVKKILGEICDSDVKKEEALDSIDQALHSLNNFLTGMERVYC